jgi:riboflavin kinase/FMN adenylyltransferase
VNNNADHRSIEVYLLDFDADIYGEHLELTFFRKLRDEKKFGSLDQLKEQLGKDKSETISFFQTINKNL